MATLTRCKMAFQRRRGARRQSRHGQKCFGSQLHRPMATAMSLSARRLSMPGVVQKTSWTPCTLPGLGEGVLGAREVVHASVLARNKPGPSEWPCAESTLRDPFCELPMLGRVRDVWGESDSSDDLTASLHCTSSQYVSTTITTLKAARFELTLQQFVLQLSNSINRSINHIGNGIRHTAPATPRTSAGQRRSSAEPSLHASPSRLRQPEKFVFPQAKQNPQASSQYRLPGPRQLSH